MINIQNAALDIAAQMPHRCANFLSTLNATIDAYCDDPSIDRITKREIADAVIDLKF